MNANEHVSGLPPYLAGLNPAQGAAVEALDGPVLVLAGAGTGKTRVLTTRLAHLLQAGRAWPSQILAVTFTNKAAQEMKQRVAAVLGGQPVEGWWLGTFHALAARMLRAHAELAGLTPQFTILDADDQLRLVKQLLEADNIDTKRFPPKALAAAIARWKDKGLTPEMVGPKDAGEVADGKGAAYYRRYQDRLKQLNACDFGDLLLHVIAILRDPAHAAVLAQYRKKFRYIMVDEYQDTNVAQYLWLRLLCDPAHNNICCVGDDDQSIYGWRGAQIDNILRFERDFPGARVVRLEQNYRSTGNILAAAGAVIANNEGRLGKTLWSAGAPGEKVEVHALWDGEAEARWVAEKIETLHKSGVPHDGMAVLVRAGFQMREFEDRFLKLNIPYRVVGGPRFYERAEIRDALAYLRVVAQPADDLALERIINVPKRGIGDTTVERLYQHARARGIPLSAAIGEMLETDELRGRAHAALKSLHDDFARWRGLLETSAHAQLAHVILEESGYIGMWQTEKTPDAAGRVENLRELVSAMAEFETLAAFLEHVSLVMENAEEAGTAKVTLMTLHAAKGLEFEAVFLPGWEEGLFPSQRSMDENGNAGLEEERRLAYVGITRAKKRAFITHAGNRRIYGNWTQSIASRFVEELPDEHISVSTDMGLYGGGRSMHWDSSGHAAAGKLAPVDFSPPARASSGGFITGARVFHEKFGAGTVVAVDGQKLDVKFDQAGFKRVMDSFVCSV
ncbi:MAG: UvrD-helicase domain-containing protein [Rhodospirillales bacterium]|nr:UvrD-helicase domain-containing protein [Rhodospirillales bacterium]USO08524.1 MAG: UvrD-helicase domain-containing protein [Rhodospirillales bacterium]